MDTDTLKRFVLLLFCFTLLLATQSSAQRNRRNSNNKPNIILMLADDLGWADLQEHDPEMRTPALTRLRSRGMFLNQSYVMPTCAPTRSALLTGRYPYTFGMQINTIKGSKVAWMNETLTLIPATLKGLGYSTHMIGKWHLGFCDWAVTPTRRGFDTFYGFYTGAQGYFNHSGDSRQSYDFRDQDEVVWSAQGKYSTELHTARAQEIIQESGNDPFFLYMSYQNVHAPFEAKQRYEDEYCGHVYDVDRRTHCAMVAALDESVRNITQTLDDEGKTDNTIIVFMSDNGGPVGGASYNYPLRGQKSTLWEGGVRSYTIISSPQLSVRDGSTYGGMVHATDWFPTFVEAAGGSVPPEVDGMSMWSTLRDNLPSPRTEFIYNFDDKGDRAAIRWNQWKLTRGRPGRKYNGWYPSPYQAGQGAEWTEVNKQTLRDRWMLFDISNDPNERNNVLDDYESVVRLMKNKMRVYEERLQPFQEARSSPEGNPRRFGGVYTPGFCNVHGN